VKLSRDLALTEHTMLAALRCMDGETRALSREVLTAARLNGVKSFNPIIEELRAMSPPEHKAIVDRLRRKLGLKTSEDLRMESMMHRGADLTSIYPTCPACGVSPVDPHTGSLKAIDPPVRRWWCDQHRDMASPGDFDEIGSGIKIAESGALVEYNPLETQRELAEQESRRRRHEAELKAREHEAEQMRRAEEARSEAFRSELPPGFGG
jgi:hypothetical protein